MYIRGSRGQGLADPGTAAANGEHRELSNSSWSLLLKHLSFVPISHTAAFGSIRSFFFKKIHLFISVYGFFKFSAGVIFTAPFLVQITIICHLCADSFLTTPVLEITFQAILVLLSPGSCKAQSY